MAQNELTDRQFWLNYWESKENLAFEVTENYPFVHILENLIKTKKHKTLLEIGGFPGYFSVWASKKLQIKATLLDFVVHQKILNDVEKANQLPENTVSVVETDLFMYHFAEKYDTVVSNGLIEHFLDTKQIVQKHAEALNPDGTLLMTLPNFRGLNGWFQKVFDRKNYDKHHIEMMDLAFLKKICIEIGLKNVQARYEGRFMLWLENPEEKPWFAKIMRFALWLPLKIFFKVFTFETALFSPYIVVIASK